MKFARLAVIALFLSHSATFAMPQEPAANAPQKLAHEDLKGIYDAAMQSIEGDKGEYPQKVIHGIELLTNAAEQGYAPAQFQLGVFYHGGPLWYDCLAQVPEKAYYWYTKAAEQKILKAQYELAWLYNPETGFEKFVDRSKYAFWMTSAAELGYPQAQHQLAKMYENGDSVDQSLEKAKFWYKKAAEQGEKWAAKALKRLEH